MQSGEFNRIQEDILRGRAQSAERAGWFSGATISLSFTLLGFLLDKQSFRYLLHYHSFLVLVLILSWLCLGVSVLCALFIRFLSEKWLYDTSSHLYLTHSSEEFARAVNAASPELAGILQTRANVKAAWLRYIELAIYISSALGIIFALIFLIALTINYF